MLFRSFTYDIIKVVPYIFILVFALTGCNVFVLLLAGIGVAGAIGFGTGSFDVPGFAQAMGSGMSGMYDCLPIATTEPTQQAANCVTLSTWCVYISLAAWI